MKYPVHVPLGLWLWIADHCVSHPQNLELTAETGRVKKLVRSSPYNQSLLDHTDVNGLRGMTVIASLPSG
jgi:hypothetical protein